MIESIVYTVKPGSFKNLRQKVISLESPAPDQVQIKIQAIGLNFADVFCVLGLYSAAPKSEFVPGLEYSGVVVSVGEAVTHFKPGDRVMGVTRFGAFANYINTGHQYVIRLPDEWSYTEGGSYLVQVLTAYYGLITLGSLQNNQTVLIHSAAGGVGLWANRICKAYYCFTIGTVSSASKLALLQAELYDQSIVRDPRNFKTQLSEALDGRDLNIIMESIGGRVLQDGFDLLAPMGRHIVFGSAHYGERTDRPNYIRLIWKYLQRPKMDPQAMIAMNKSLMAFNLIYLFEHQDLMHDLLHQIELLQLGKPVIGSTFDFDELPDALRRFQSGKTTGKQVILIE